MPEHIFLENYGDDDVCSFGSTMFKVGKLRQVMESAIAQYLEPAVAESFKSNQLQINTMKYDTESRRNIQQQWFGEGIESETLKIGGKGWQKGKVKIRITVEFCPDKPEVDETSENNNSETNQPESPLDDLRRQLLDPEKSPS